LWAVRRVIVDGQHRGLHPSCVWDELHANFALRPGRQRCPSTRRCGAIDDKLSGVTARNTFDHQCTVVLSWINEADEPRRGRCADFMNAESNCLRSEATGPTGVGVGVGTGVGIAVGVGVGVPLDA